MDRPREPAQDHAVPAEPTQDADFPGCRLVPLDERVHDDQVADGVGMPRREAEGGLAPHVQAREGDPVQFGHYLLDSLSNQAKPAGRADPLSTLTEQARLFPGCLGSVRLPGAAAHLISHHLVPRFVEALSRLDPGITHQTLASG